MSNKKYSNHLHKELMWREIARTLNQPGCVKNRFSRKLVFCNKHLNKIINFYSNLNIFAQVCKKT